MRSIRSRDFKNSFERYLGAVRRGKTLVITDDGKPSVKVTLNNSAGKDRAVTVSDVLERLEAEGKIRLGKKPFRKIKPVRSRGKSASEMIIEDRR